tara:strand:+ start:516 stop:665 length:150 start_codon:yes stop_codon:yes gene_type:complete
MNEKELYTWCIQQLRDKLAGNLSSKQIEKLDDVGFPWDMYKKEVMEVKK